MTVDPTAFREGPIPMATNDFTISPSKLSYDLGGCHRCFAESLNGESWPDRPFPGLFSRLDRQQRSFYDGKPTSLIDPNLPAGIIRNAKGVLSQPFEHDGVSLTIRGTLDAIAEFDDGTIGVIDFKSSIPNSYLGDRYRPQLSAYHWALTRPAKSEPQEVSKLGLLIVCPEAMADTNQGLAQLVSTTWIEVDYNETWFTNLLKEICGIATDPASAESHSDCEWCVLRDQLRI
jgi:hypothetical protein